MAEKIKLSILGISFSQVQAGAYALIFAEENGVRRLPIVIGAPEAQSIAIVMENIKPPRPLSHDLMYSIFQLLGIELIEVFICKFDDGAFFSELLIKQNNSEYSIDSRTSDAIALALRTNSPIYTTEQIMKDMGIVFDEKSSKDVDTITETSETTDFENLTTLQIDALRGRLEEAIRDEDYELATILRDELKRRKDQL